MKAFVLLVTWFVPGMPPNSYQTTFDSLRACEAAKVAVHAEERRVLVQFLQRADAATGGQGQEASYLATRVAPAVSAVCVSR
jgi:hypothetical protein